MEYKVAYKMVEMKKYIVSLLAFLPVVLFAQNITDIAVMNDKSADGQIENSTE